MIVVSFEWLIPSLHLHLLKSNVSLDVICQITAIICTHMFLRKHNHFSIPVLRVPPRTQTVAIGSSLKNIIVFISDTGEHSAVDGNYLLRYSILI